MIFALQTGHVGIGAGEPLRGLEEGGVGAIAFGFGGVECGLDGVAVFAGGEDVELAGLEVGCLCGGCCLGLGMVLLGLYVR